MRQDLIDLSLGELEPAAEMALREEMRNDPALAQEFADLCALRTFLERRDELDAGDAVRTHVLAAAKVAVRPSWTERLAQIPGLIRYRFRHSIAFRAAAVALGIHLVVTGVLLSNSVRSGRKTGSNGTVAVVHEPDIEALAVKPAADFVLRLQRRRVPHAGRLRRFGIADQGKIIRAGLSALLDSQRADGSFGSPVRTAWAATALLAEGHSSINQTRSGQALRRARDGLLAAAQNGRGGGAVLTALAEDYAFAYAELFDVERREYVLAIDTLIRSAPRSDTLNPAWSEALTVAHMIGFRVPADRVQAAAQTFDLAQAATVLQVPATRLAVTAVLAQGPTNVPLDQVRAWAAPLFEQAKARLAAEAGDPRQLLVLQSPYRF